MCGIAGFHLTRPDPRIQTVMELLGLSNISRGTDSWGLFIADGEQLHKGVGSLGLEYHRYKPLIPDQGIMFMHTRAKSFGEVTLRTAHPWKFTSRLKKRKNISVFGAHNGTVSNWEDLNTQYKRKFIIDSPHIFQHLVDGRSLDDIEGKGAIEFWRSSSPDRVYLSYFNGGELAIAGLKDDKGNSYGMVWSSEKNHLTTSLIGGGFEDEEFETYKLSPQKLYYWGDNRLYFDGEFLVDIKTPVYPTLYTGYLSGPGMWQGHQSWERGECSTNHLPAPTNSNKQRRLLRRSADLKGSDIAVTLRIVGTVH
jgi:hypothetical protein